MSDEDEKKEARAARKERVLHTRVPAVLEQELKRVANAWRVPVSNVVRALLEDALDTIDVVGAKAEDELRGVAQKLASERHRIRRKSSEQRSKTLDGPGTPQAAQGDTAPDPLEGAVGVTPITLVHDAECALTGRPLAAGSDAYLVLFDDPNRKLITGRDALPRASTSKKENADD
jgi:hypothetical protein